MLFANLLRFRHWSDCIAFIFFIFFIRWDIIGLWAYQVSREILGILIKFREKWVRPGKAQINAPIDLIPIPQYTINTINIPISEMPSHLLFENYKLPPNKSIRIINKTCSVNKTKRTLSLILANHLSYSRMVNRIIHLGRRLAVRLRLPPILRRMGRVLSRVIIRKVIFRVKMDLDVGLRRIGKGSKINCQRRILSGWSSIMDRTQSPQLAQVSHQYFLLSARAKPQLSRGQQPQLQQPKPIPKTA